MLTSVKIQKRQSEIRQALAALVGKDKPSEEETRSMSELDAEYQGNETRYRAALIAEDTERKAAGKDLESRGSNEWAELVNRFELRQVALHLDEGRAIDGATAEIVQELRSKGGYRGIPVPWAALERRVGETVASGVFDPKTTHDPIDRLFPDSVAARMGASLINIDSGIHEWPITTSSVTAGWAATETGNVAGPTVFATTDRTLTPAQNLGIQVKLTRKSMKQSGAALEQAVRRDINGTMQSILDKAVFLGAGSSGEPLGIVTGQSTYGYGTTAVSAAASWAAFRAVVSTFMAANSAKSPSEVRVLTHPQAFNYMDGQYVTNTAVSQWDLLTRRIPEGNIALSSNAAVLTAGTPDTTTALLATSAGGVAPIFVGTWGAVDLIRDVYSDAASGMLRLTALITADVTISRAAQLHLLTALQVE